LTQSAIPEGLLTDLETTLPAAARATAPQLGDSLADLPRVLGAVGAADQGATLLCVGGLHGNEPAGVRALQRIFRRLEGREGSLRGRLIGFSGNRCALAMGRRYLDKDLNRSWTPERLDAATSGRPDVEDLEMWELQSEFQHALEMATGDVFLLDLHTTSGPSCAFAVLDDTLPNREYAIHFPVPLVLGLEEELTGTMANYLSSQGVTSVGFEAGQHDEAVSVERAEAAIWIALDATGILPIDGNREVAAARRRLAEEHRHLPEVVEVRHRHEVLPGDGFIMREGFQNFQPVKAGADLADDRHGRLRAPLTGLMLLPLYQKQGEDGFFVVKPVNRGWLELSKFVRRMRVERWVHWIPGVAPHPELPGGFTVDRRIARWGALEIFHLLGFRRHGPADRFLVLYRRDHSSKEKP